MPIRDRLSRIINKSGSNSGSNSGSSDGSSSSSSAQSGAYTVSANTSTTNSSIAKTPRTFARSYASAHSRLSKRATWLTPASRTSREDVLSFAAGPKPISLRSSKPAVKSYHPSERRLNERQLRHQEMLGSFTMKFGRKRRFSHGAGSNDLPEISPCNSRAASVDIDRSARTEDDQDEGPLGERRTVPSVGGGPIEAEMISDDDSWAAGVLGFLTVNCDDN